MNSTQLVSIFIVIALLAGCGGESGGVQVSDTTSAESSNHAQQLDKVGMNLPLGYYRDTRTGEELFITSVNVFSNENPEAELWYSANKQADWKQLILDTNWTGPGIRCCFAGGSCHVFNWDSASNKIICTNPDASVQRFDTLHQYWLWFIEQSLIPCMGLPCYSDEVFFMAQEGWEGGGPEARARYIKSAIEYSEGQVQYLNQTTYIITTPGKTIRLIGTSGDYSEDNLWLNYMYEGWVKEIRSHVFLEFCNPVVGRCRGEVILVHSSTGDTLRLHTKPSVIPAPRENEFFVSGCSDYYQHRCCDFAHYRSDDNGFHLLWKSPQLLHGDLPFLLDTPRWLSADTVHILKDGFPVFFIRTGNTWQERPFHLP